MTADLLRLLAALLVGAAACIALLIDWYHDEEADA